MFLRAKQARGRMILGGKTAIILMFAGRDFDIASGGLPPHRLVMSAVLW